MGQEEPPATPTPVAPHPCVQIRPPPTLPPRPGPQWQAPSQCPPRWTSTASRRGAAHVHTHAEMHAARPPTPTDNRRTGTNVCAHRDLSSPTVTGGRALSQAQRTTCGRTNTPAERRVPAHGSTGRGTLGRCHGRCPFPNMRWHSASGGMSHGCGDGSEPGSPDAAWSRAGRPPPTAHRLGCSEPGASPAVIKPF